MDCEKKYLNAASSFDVQNQWDMNTILKAKSNGSSVNEIRQVSGSLNMTTRDFDNSGYKNLRGGTQN